jgi:hypothetical protein
VVGRKTSAAKDQASSCEISGCKHGGSIASRESIKKGDAPISLEIQREKDV